MEELFMKRLILLVLCLTMAASLAACGGSTAGPTEAAPDPTAAPETTAAPTDAVQPTQPEYTMEHTPLTDNESCRFTITGMDFNDHLGLQIYVLCENLSDRPLTFTWNGTSVCGFMYDPLWAEDVAAGKSINSTIGIDTYALEQIGIDSVDEITFTLQVSDSEEFMNEPLVNQTHTIYPTGKTAETVVFPAYAHKEGEAVIVNENGITFIIEGVDDELADFYTLNCYIANNTDKDLLFAWEDSSVNGFMANPFWAATVSAGKQAYSEIIFYRSDLDAHDIEVVQSIAFTLQVSDYSDWEADYLLNKTYTFKPQ